jgi:hypothetical protein
MLGQVLRRAAAIDGIRPELLLLRNSDDTAAYGAVVYIYGLALPYQAGPLKP